MKFTGFSMEDFLCFPYGSRERKLEVKEKLYRFIEAVSQKLKYHDPKLHRKLTYKGVGNLERDATSCWGYLSKAKFQSNSTHFNFIVDDEGLAVGVHLERPAPIRRLIGNIQDDMSGFLKTLGSLEKDVIIIIHERIPRLGKDGQPLPRRFDWQLLCRLRSRRFDRFALDYLLDELETLEYSAISFRSGYYWTYDLELLNSDKIVDSVAETIALLQPIYAFTIR